MAQGFVRTATLLAAALVGAALVVLPGTWLVLRSETTRFAAAQQAETRLVLAETKVALDAALAARLTTLRALAAFAASRPEVTDTEYAIFAEGLAASLPDIRSLQLARDLVVSHVHPKISNDGILGLPLLTRLPAAQLATIERAMTSGAPALDGPVPLIQGGSGLILRVPVQAAAAGPASSRPWGLATVILDAGAFFDLATPPASGLRLAIRAGGDGEHPGRLLTGNAAVFDDAPVRLTMETPGGPWHLAATPLGGWSALVVPPTLVGGSLATWLALSAALFVLVSWPARLAAAVTRATAALAAAREDLENTVARRTADLTDANEALRTLYEHAPVGIFTSTPGGRYIKANAFLARMYGFDAPEELLDHVGSIQDQVYVDFAERHRLLELLETHGALPNHEIRRLTRTGAVIWVSLNILAVRDAAGVITRLEGFCTDVTERKQAEAALARQERELRIIFEKSPLGLVSFGPDGTILKCNERLLALMGTSAEAAMGANILARMPALVRDALAKALAGEPTQVEGTYTSVLGQRSFILRAAFNPVASGANPTAVIASMEDVTDQRRQEQTLRLLRAAVEQSPASIVITDETGCIEYVNPYFTELTGYSAEEVRGKTPRVLSSGIHDQAFFQAMWETLQAGNVWRGELCNRKRNGELYWEDSSISPIRGDKGEITHYVAVKEDITARKEREARLHRLMTEFEAIFNASSVGIVHLGSDGRVVRTNHRFAELFGLAPGELDGNTLDAVHDAEPRRQALRRDILAAVAAGQDASVEERFRNRAGRPFWCSVHGRAIDRRTPGAGSIWIFDDITPRKELESIREDVERIMRHDLKAPLNSILNLPDIIAALGDTTPEQRDLLGEIEQTGRLMLEQIDFSLDLHKMETGGYVPETQQVDLCRVVGGAAEMLQKPAAARGVAIAVETPDGTAVFARANALLLQTTAANLIKNAIEADPAGSTVRVRFFQTEAQAGFAVTNAALVPADITPVFFEKYATSGKSGGSGLGTYSARLMTECQGGDIRMTTAPETGTTVTVRLPLA
ncbi:PAS domain S-box protein [Solidesulfovibrio sp.]